MPPFWNEWELQPMLGLRNKRKMPTGYVFMGFEK
jgi:hypothetical protein